MKDVARDRKPFSKSRAIWALVAFACVGTIGYLSYARMRGPIVNVVAVEKTRVVQRVVATGHVIAPSEVAVGTVAVGRVSHVHVQQGQRVTQGQELVTLEDSEAQASVAQARASLSQAQARLSQVSGVRAQMADEQSRQAELRYEQAKNTFEREQSLFSAGASTQQRLDDAQKSLEIAKSTRDSLNAQAADLQTKGADHRAVAAAVAQARASLDLATVRLDQTRMVAPMSAIVLQRLVEPGDVVQPGRTLMTLASNDAVQLSVQIDEKNLPLVRVGQSARASADAYPWEVFDAKVESLAPRVDAATGTVEAKLSVPKPPAFLLSDMSVSVTLDAPARDGVMLVPSRAIAADVTSDPYVIVVTQNRTQLRKVRLGIVDKDRREIVSGLTIGDQVVADVDTTKPDKKVRPNLIRQPEQSNEP